MLGPTRPRSVQEEEAEAQRGSLGEDTSVGLREENLEGDGGRCRKYLERAARRVVALRLFGIGSGRVYST